MVWTHQSIHAFVIQPSQRYVHYIMESAQYLYQDISTMNNFFNWTMTYRCDKDKSSLRTLSKINIQEGLWLLSSLREDSEGEGAPRGGGAEGVHQEIWPRQQASRSGKTQTGSLVCQPLRNTGNLFTFAVLGREGLKCSFVSHQEGLHWCTDTGHFIICYIYAGSSGKVC